MDIPSRSDFRDILYKVEPLEFEHLVADLWREQGWKAQVTQASNDSGIDVVCQRESPFTQKQLIQVKRYGPETTVSSSEVQQYASLRQQEENVDAVIIITSATYSRQAITIAKKLNVKLIDGGDLYDMILNQGCFDVIVEYMSTSLQYQSSKSASSPSGSHASDPQPSRNLTEQWKFTTNADNIRNPPKVSDGAVYVTGDHLYKLDSIDGTVEWDLTLPCIIRSRLAVNEEKVFLGGDDYYAYAVSKSTGRKLWTFKTNSVVDSIVVTDGIVYLKSILGGRLYAVDATDGTEEWVWNFGDHSHQELAVDEDTVYLDSSGSFFAVDAQTGSLRWKTRHGASIVGTSRPVVIDGVAYVENAEDGILNAIDTQDGTEIWSFEPRGDIWTPAVTEGTIYLTDNEQGVYAVDASSGQEQWSVWLDENATEPTVVDDTVFIGSWDGNIYGLSTSDGSEKWSNQTSSSRTFVPSVTDDSVITATDDGEVYSLSIHL